MVKRVFYAVTCCLLLLALGGCSAKPGVEFSGEDIWSDPAVAESLGGHSAVQEIFERAITSKEADTLYISSESTNDKSAILKFQKLLSQMKLSPLENQTEFPAETDSGSGNLFWLRASDKELLSISVYDNGYVVVSAGMASSSASFCSIDNFEDIKEDYEKLLKELKK